MKASDAALKCRATTPTEEGPRTKDQGPRTKDQGPRTKDQGPRTKDQGPMTKDQGPRTNDFSPILYCICTFEHSRAYITFRSPAFCVPPIDQSSNVADY